MAYMQMNLRDGALLFGRMVPRLAPHVEQRRRKGYRSMAVCRLAGRERGCGGTGGEGIWTTVHAPPFLGSCHTKVLSYHQFL